MNPLTRSTATSEAAYGNRESGHAPREIYEGLWRWVGDEVAGAVLDCGCGKGNWLSYLSKSPKVTQRFAADFVREPLPEGVRWAKCDLSYEALPFEAHSMDWVFAIEVLEHLENPRFFFREVVRVLKPGGHFVLTTPNNASLRSRISVLLRGWFPALSDHDYRASGHVTTVLPLDLSRMAQESEAEIEFAYPLPGNLPGSRLRWQSFFPWIKGERFSDCLFAKVTK